MSTSIAARLGTLLLFSLMAAAAVAQESYVRWRVELDPKDARAGESARILIQAEILDGWHIYGLKKVEGPIPTTLSLEPGSVLKPEGEVVAPKPIQMFDENFGVDVELFEKQPIFAIPVKLDPSATGPQKGAVKIGWQACTEGTCDLPKSETYEFTFEVGAGPVRPERTAALTEVPDQPEQVQPAAKPAPGAQPATGTDEFGDEFQKAKASGLWAFMVLSFVGGLLALLTPCVFPMIPITVSFFSKKVGQEKKANYGGAAAYCLGIISTFSAMGLIVTLAVGPTGIQRLATNPWVNLAVFLIFVALALSLFGVYEIRVPSGVLSKLSSNSRAAGVVGPLLMGLTFSLTSFTCTVPIVGTLLAAAAAGESFLYPLLGMVAFSTAFSLPFFFLALFPDLISRLPKAGSWMTQVKIFMGFLELAAAVKFLSNIDLVLQWGLLTKPVFLAIWTVIAAVAALQLLGWIRMSHEPIGEPAGWLRRGFGLATGAAAVYCLAGIQGAPIGELSAFLPPDPYPGKASAVVGPVAWRHSYDEGVAASRAEGKPIFLNFTGVT